MIENTGRGVDVGDVIRVAHGVGGSTTEWQRSPPAHAVYMIPLGDRYDENEWSTVKVWYEHGEILKMTDGANGPNGTPFAHDVDMLALHPIDYARVRDAIDADLFGDRDAAADGGTHRTQPDESDEWEYREVGDHVVRERDGDGPHAENKQILFRIGTAEYWVPQRMPDPRENEPYADLTQLSPNGYKYRWLATWYLYRDALPMVDVDNSDVLTLDADAFSYTYDRDGRTHILLHDEQPDATGLTDE